MKRDFKKALAEYEKISRRGKGLIYFSDMQQIKENCKGDIAEMVMRSIEYGIVIGYRLGKRESQKH